MNEAIQKYKAEVFQSLAHPTRVAIVELLSNGELSAGALCQKLGLEQANVSQHLAILRAKNILSARKVANNVFYSIRDPAIKQVFELLRGFCLTHLAEMSRMMAGLEPNEDNGGGS
jgi:ArsR family transcriptional regulator